jgi:catechol 2,3-dioxygenase-like lactoylglutathione lyase family enzyme
MEVLDRHAIPATNGEVASLRSKGSQQILELNWYPRRRYRSGSELDHLAFDVEGSDVDREVERLLGLGATRARETEVRPKYVVAFVRDPDGAWIELYKAR